MFLVKTRPWYRGLSMALDYGADILKI
jgi:hypothetical protein